MKIALSFVSPPDHCSYLQEQIWRLRYDVALELTPAEYQIRMEDGWRRFGHSMFKPDCETCRACQSLRIDVNAFTPNRSQKRAEKANADVSVSVGPPRLTEDRLELYDRFHASQVDAVGWQPRTPESATSYYESFVDNPFVTQEWCYYLEEQLIAIGYVDRLPHSLSAIYFFYDPDFRDRSLGTFNVLSVLKAARAQRLKHLYLGYYVDGCRSLQYKGNFEPHELLIDGKWTRPTSRP